MKPIVVIAVGGNSLTRPGESGTFAEQQRNARTTCQGIAAVIEAGYRVVLTHGNGPQVGRALLRSELAQPSVPQLRLDVCDAETEGEIGYLLEQTLTNVLTERSLEVGVSAILTQVVVDAADRAFRNPTKPIGPFYTVEEALERRRALGWTMLEDSGRGWRRLVPSPEPLEIVEMPAIQACLERNLVVIAAGGGGIPVLRSGGKLQGIEAVIDKDRASALLAKGLGADVLLFSTGVEFVYRNFGRNDARPISELTFEEAEKLLEAGYFPSGSMGPKIEAALRFLAVRGERAVVTSPENIAAAVEGRAGTQILPPDGSALDRRWQQLELQALLESSLR